MRKNIERIMEIPEGVTINFKDNEITVKKDGNELKRVFEFGKVELSISGDELKLLGKQATKRELKMIGTLAAHIKNMIKGVSEEFIYKLEICNVHFPMNVKVDGNHIRIKSFLGEKIDRLSKIVDGSKVNIQGNIIEVTSRDIEVAGQTAANLEQATKVRGRDRRIFQDGIFITEKPGRVI